MERKNLHTSHVNQTYEVSRKHCGKRLLRWQECSNFASQNIKPQNNKTFQSPATPSKIVLGETSLKQEIKRFRFASLVHPNRKATSLNPDTLSKMPEPVKGERK